MNKIISFIFLFLCSNPCFSQSANDTIIGLPHADDAYNHFSKQHYRSYAEQVIKLQTLFKTKQTIGLDTLVTHKFTKTANYKTLQYVIENAISIDFSHAGVFCEVSFPVQKSENKLNVNFSKFYNDTKWTIHSSLPSFAEIASLLNKSYEGSFVETYFNDFKQNFNTISEYKINGTRKHNLYINKVILKKDNKIDTVYFKFSYYDMTHKENHQPRSGYILEDFVSTLKVEEDSIPKKLF